MRVHHQHAQRGRIAERHVAREHLVDQHTERVEIRALVDLCAGRLLRRHVAGRADDRARARQRRLAALLAGVLDKPGDAEVEHLDHVALTVPVDQHDVLRLEIPVHDALGVGSGESASDLRANPQEPWQRHRAARAQGVVQRLAVDQLHRDKEPALVGRAEVVEVDGVGVLDARRGLHLAAEPGEGAAVGRQIRLQHLQRDLAPDGQLFREVDRAHAASAERPLDAVAPREHHTR